MLDIWAQTSEVFMSLPRFLSLMTFLLVTGCGLPANQITSSTSPIPGGVRGTVPVHGDDCQYKLLMLLPLTSYPSTQEALSDAKAACGCDVLTDVTVDDSWGTVLLWSWRCVNVEGLGVPPHKTGEKAGDYDGVEETS